MAHFIPRGIAEMFVGFAATFMVAGVCALADKAMDAAVAQFAPEPLPMVAVEPATAPAPMVVRLVTPPTHETIDGVAVEYEGEAIIFR